VINKEAFQCGLPLVFEVEEEYADDDPARDEGVQQEIRRMEE